MADRIVLERFFLEYPLSLQVCLLGDDLLVVVTGGCRPHVGSVSGAYWENGSIHCETSVGQCHRDDVISKRFAEMLCRQFQCNVSVTCGIHYEALSKESVNGVIAETESLLLEAIESITLYRFNVSQRSDHFNPLQQ